VRPNLPCPVCGIPLRVHGCNVIVCKAPGEFVPKLRLLAPALEELVRSIHAAKTVGEVRALRPVVNAMVERLDKARWP